MEKKGFTRRERISKDLEEWLLSLKEGSKTDLVVSLLITKKNQISFISAIDKKYFFNQSKKEPKDFEEDEGGDLEKDSPFEDRIPKRSQSKTNYIG